MRILQRQVVAIEFDGHIQGAQGGLLQHLERPFLWVGDEWNELMADLGDLAGGSDFRLDHPRLAQGIHAVGRAQPLDGERQISVDLPDRHAIANRQLPLLVKAEGGVVRYLSHCFLGS